jgi:hypothetical protein
MSNPIQTVTGSGNLNSLGILALTFTTRPSVGNWIIVPLLIRIPYPLPVGVSVVDINNNNFTKLFSQGLTDSYGGTVIQALYALQIPSNAGTPNYAVNIESYTSRSLSPFVEACAFECSQLATSQPDLTPTSLQQGNGGPALTLTPQLPTQTNDFCVAVMSVNGQSTWNTQAGWNVALANQNDSAHLVNGEIDWQQESGSLITSVSVNWTSISDSTAPNQGFLVLFQGAPPSVSTSYQAGSARPLGLPAKLTSDNNLKLKPGLGKPLGLAVQLTGRSYWAVPGLAAPLGLPAQCTSSGNLTLTGLPGYRGPIGLPASLTFTSPSLQVKRGPLSMLANITLKEGEFFEAGLMEGGVAYTLLFIGGHDGQKKLVNGMPTSSGVPSWSVGYDGFMVLDSAYSAVYISKAAGGWTTLNIP